MEQTPVPTTVTVEVSDLGDVFSMLPSEVLATNILRRWDREKIESFARHLLGDEPHVVPANLAPVPVSDRTRCSWTLSGDRWIAACGTDTPDCPPPPNCPGCGCRIVTEKTNGDTKAEWTKVLRDPCYYQRNIGSVLSGAIKDAIDYIEAQGEKIDRLTTLNASLNEQNVGLAEAINGRFQRAIEFLDRAQKAEAEQEDLRGRLDGLMEALNIENLAAIQHEIWSKWMIWMFANGGIATVGGWTMHAEKILRWTRQAHTVYDDLSEPEKQSDRDVVQECMGNVFKALAAARGEKEA